MEEVKGIKMCAFMPARECDLTCAAFASHHGGETNCHRIEASIHQAIGLMRIAMHYADQDEEDEGPCMCEECAEKAEAAAVGAEKKATTEEAVGGGMYR
jgi:hypothetical protein